MNKKLLEEYAELKLQAKAIAERIEILNPQIKEMIIKEGADKLKSDFGTFSIEKRATWKYSPAVEKLQDEEKAKGIATQVVTTNLKFTPPKKETL